MDKHRDASGRKRLPTHTHKKAKALDRTRMERTVLLGVVTWVGGVGAWAVGAGYALASSRHSQGGGTGSGKHAPGRGSYVPPGARTNTRVRWDPELVLDDDGTAPTPVEADVVDLGGLAAPPLSLGTPTSTEGTTAASADASKQLTAAEEEEEKAAGGLPGGSRSRGGAGSGGSSKDGGTDGGSALAESSFELRRPEGIESMGELITESQRRRLAPIKSLKRVRRSRKIRRESAEQTDFVPLVPGARATTEESILNAYTGDTIEAKREQGEDYWVDPDLVQTEQSREAKKKTIREEFVNNKDNYSEQKLKQEIVAPYKNNLIGVVTVSIGVAAVIFSMFPSLLELNAPLSIASFPESL